MLEVDAGFFRHVLVSHLRGGGQSLGRGALRGRYGPSVNECQREGCQGDLSRGDEFHKLPCCERKCSVRDVLTFAFCILALPFALLFSQIHHRDTEAHRERTTENRTAFLCVRFSLCSFLCEPPCLCDEFFLSNIQTHSSRQGRGLQDRLSFTVHHSTLMNHCFPRSRRVGVSKRRSAMGQRFSGATA